MRKLLLVAALLALASPAAAQDVIRFGVGAQAVWYDDGTYPSDFEVGGNAAASLSPHLSLVGSAYYGLDKNYLTGAIGARITTTDANDANFSIGVGLSYRASSKVGVRPEGFAPDVSIGWRAWPEQLPKVLLAGQGGYGLDNNEAFIIAGVRYALGE